MTIEITTELSEIAPHPGSRDPWLYKKFCRFGMAFAPAREFGKGTGEIRLDQYGIYGIRPTDKGWELYLQYEGWQTPEGVQHGVSTLSSSGDFGTYFWLSVSSMAEYRIFPDLIPTVPMPRTVTISVEPEDAELLQATLTEAARGINEAADGATDHPTEIRLRRLAGRVYAAVQS